MAPLLLAKNVIIPLPTLTAMLIVAQPGYQGTVVVSILQTPLPLPSTSTLYQHSKCIVKYIFCTAFDDSDPAPLPRHVHQLDCLIPRVVIVGRFRTTILNAD